MDRPSFLHRAAQDGVILSPAIAAEALAAVDPTEIEKSERARYEVKVWKAGEPCPHDDEGRWKHGNDAISRAAIESHENGGVVYFLFCDGELRYWQPFRHDQRVSTRFARMIDEPGHADHWEDAAEAHVSSLVRAEVEHKHYVAALDKALEVHETRAVPVVAAAPRKL